MKGIRVEHVCGNPLLSKDDDRQLMERIAVTGLKAIQTRVTGPTLFEPGETARAEAAHA